VQEFTAGGNTQLEKKITLPTIACEFARRFCAVFCGVSCADRTIAAGFNLQFEVQKNANRRSPNQRRVAQQSEAVHRLQAELSKTIVGQKEMISRLMVGC